MAKQPESGQTRTNLEGDDEVHLLAHNCDEPGSQMAREADLWMLCVVVETKGSKQLSGWSVRGSK